MSYAENTSVSADKSRAEIERTLQRYGASSFGYGWQGTRAVITFEAHGRRIQFQLSMPDPQSREFTVTPGGRRSRSPQQAQAAWEQATRQRWRALALVVKAKLEAVASGITTFEDEFLAHTLIPSGDGRGVITVGEMMQPQVDAAYNGNQIPRGLVLALPAGGDE